MKLLLIMNPGSRCGKGKRFWDDWVKGLNAEGVSFEVRYTQSMQDPFDFAKHAKGFDVVVAVGGDGTINRVADGIIQSDAPSTKMGVLYAGTSPDFCKFHNIPIEPNDALNILLKGHAETVDVAKIIYRDISNRIIISHFVCSCNIGLGASIAKNANHWRKYLGDSLGTGLSAIYSLFACPSIDLNMNFCKQNIIFTKNNNLSVVINPYIASGLKLKINKNPDDGVMWILGVNGKNKIALLLTLPKYYNGQIVRAKNVLLEKTNNITISASQSQEIEFDGDQRGYLPVKIELLPKALNLIKRL